VCEGLILERSVIGLLLAGDSSCFDKEARQSLDDDSLLLVVELLSRARLRDRDVEEDQMQLGHGSPGLDPMLPAHRRRDLGEHRPGCETEQVFRRAGQGKILRRVGGGVEVRAFRRD
jgi:hypothetical protein